MTGAAMVIGAMRTRVGKLKDRLHEQRPALAVTMSFLDLGGRLVCAQLSDGRTVSAARADGLPLLQWCQIGTGG